MRRRLVKAREPLRPYEDFSWKEPRLKARRKRVQVRGRLAAMSAVEDSRMYQKVQSAPKGSVKE